MYYGPFSKQWALFEFRNHQCLTELGTTLTLTICCCWWTCWCNCRTLSGADLSHYINCSHFVFLMAILTLAQIDVNEFSYLRLIREFLTRFCALNKDWKALNNLAKRYYYIITTKIVDVRHLDVGWCIWIEFKLQTLNIVGSIYNIWIDVYTHISQIMCNDHINLSYTLQIKEMLDNKLNLKHYHLFWCSYVYQH